MQRIDAIKAIAQNLHDLITDATCVSLTGSSVMANELIHPNAQQLLGKYFYTYGTGAAAGQERVVGSLNTARREILFTQVFASLPSVNTTFLLTDYWRKSEYDSALNRSIGKIQLTSLVERVATLNLVATQYEYAVPSGFEWISTLRLVPSNNTDYGNLTDTTTVFEIPPRYWRIERNAVGTYILTFDSRKIDLKDFDKQWVNVMGQAAPDITGTDNADIPRELSEFIISNACMLLASQRIEETQEWKAKFYMFRDDVRGLEAYVNSYGRGKKVK